MSWPIAFSMIGPTGPTGNTGPTGQTGPTGFTGQQGDSYLNWVVDPGSNSNTYISIIDSSEIKGVLGGGNLWDGRAASQIPISGACRIQFSCDLPFAFVGLSQNPSYASQDVINYFNAAIYFDTSNTYRVNWYNGSISQQIPASGYPGNGYSASNIFSIVYDGTTFYWYKDQTLLYSQANYDTQPLYFTVALNTQASPGPMTLTNLQFLPIIYNGTGPTGANGDKFNTQTTSAVTINPSGTGSIDLNVASNLAYITGNSVVVVDQANSANRFEANVTSYSIGGALSLGGLTNIQGSFTGSAVYNVNLDGIDGPTGPTGPVVPYIFDGGDPFSVYFVGPAFDCGTVN